MGRFLGIVVFTLLCLVVIGACDFVFFRFAGHVAHVLHLPPLAQTAVLVAFILLPLVILLSAGEVARRIGLIEGSFVAVLSLFLFGLFLCYEQLVLLGAYLGI